MSIFDRNAFLGQVRLFGSHLSSPAETPRSRALKDAICSSARAFQDAIDRPSRATREELDGYERTYNEAYDNLLLDGFAYDDIYEHIRGTCFVRDTIIRTLRPKPWTNNYTNKEVPRAGDVRRGVVTPNAPVRPSVTPERPEVATPATSSFAPESTGGAHSYQEEAGQYAKQIETFSKRQTPAPVATGGKSPYMTSEEVQTEAQRRHNEWANCKEPNVWDGGSCHPPCLPPNFWDGRQCRGSVATGGAGGGLVSQAASMAPSGGVAAGVPFTMGRRFPVVNV